MDGGTVVAVDVDADGRRPGRSRSGSATSASSPTSATRSARSTPSRAAGVGPADLTVVVVNATGCEPTAILLTAQRGTVLFYSMATSFQTAALTADGQSADITMIVGNGFAPDCGAYALDLYRRTPALREAFVA